MFLVVAGEAGGVDSEEIIWDELILLCVVQLLKLLPGNVVCRLSVDAACENGEGRARCELCRHGGVHYADQSICT